MVRRALLFALAVIAAACSRESSPSPSSRTPVILISVDTLRADRLPAWGYRGVVTPNLERLRNESILYRNAYSHCPLTLPSHATIFTGQLPAENGIRDNVGYRLDEEAVTLAESLRDNGYATGGAISSFVLREATGISQGFAFWEDDVEMTGPNMTIGRIQRDGAETIELAGRWIAEQTDPLFFFLHLYEPHTPYAPPEPYASRYADRYDGEIAYSDDLVGRFLDLLREKGIYDDALIIFFSDHGEGLGDHGEDEHGIFLYREAIQVPLMVKLPGGARAGETVETPVQLSDIFPTVLELSATAGEIPPHSASLLSFVGRAPVERRIYSETYYPRFHFGWNDLHSLVDARYHMIQAPKPELFDLASDPKESRNVLEENRRTFFAMQNEIAPLIRQAAAPAPVDAEEAAKLAALGYLGSTVQTSPDEVLPDPKDKIDTFRDIQKAFTMARKGEQQEALALIDAILADNPRMLDVWALRSRTLATLGREQEAIEAAKEGLRLAPNASHLAIQIANLSLELGDLDQARDHAELVVSSEPAQAHEVLARIWIARKDFEKAEEEARKALETDGDRVISLLTLARVEKERQNFEKSLQYLDQAKGLVSERENRAISNLHYLRGDVLARLGRFEEAEADLRKEIEFFPDSPAPYKNLVLLLVTQDRNDEATALIFALAKESPTPPAYRAIIDTLETLGDDRGVRFWARRALAEYPKADEFRAFL